MNLKKKIAVVTILLINIFNYSFASENKILIKVNNEIITTVDILNEIKFLSIANKEFEKIEKKKQIQIAKDSLIREKIKSIELLKFRKNLDVNDKIFGQVIKNYFFNQSIKDLEDYEIFLKRNNLNLEFVRKKISIDTFWKGLIYEKFNKNVKIDVDKIKKNLLKQEKQKEYMLSEIVFSLDENETFDQKLLEITNLIKRGTFSEAALNFSMSDTSKNGGKLGWIKENVVNEKIKNELAKINIGEYTNPIVIPGGFLILNIEDIREVKKILDIDDEIKNTINKKTNDQLNRLSNIYLKKLRKNTRINEV